jgi:flagellar FliJ protein
MSWTASLIKLRKFEIDELRKRLGAILDRRAELDAALVALGEEAAREDAHARSHAEAGFYLIGFREGWKQRRARVEAELRTLAVEEQGTRDALSEAFEGLKTVEQVADSMAATEAKALAQRETQALDELALRRRAQP